VIWAETKIERITERNVIVRYAAEAGRLDRHRLWADWALWRNVYFISSRTGRAAQLLDAIWQDRYGRAAGGVPPVMRMALTEAMALLGVPANFSKEDVLAAFRREAKKAHPDAGGTAEMFRRLVEARDRLLASLGTSAPAPKPPAYAPKGAFLRYTRVKLSGAPRIGSTRRLGR
jgi:rRNA maturation protein Nop10